MHHRRSFHSSHHQVGVPIAAAHRAIPRADFSEVRINRICGRPARSRSGSLSRLRQEQGKNRARLGCLTRSPLILAQQSIRCRQLLKTVLGATASSLRLLLFLSSLFRPLTQRPIHPAAHQQQQNQPSLLKLEMTEHYPHQRSAPLQAHLEVSLSS